MPGGDAAAFGMHVVHGLEGNRWPLLRVADLMALASGGGIASCRTALGRAALGLSGIAVRSHRIGAHVYGGAAG